MIAFIETHREVFGVEPICRVLQIAPATFHRHAATARNPELASDRARQDAVDLEKIKAAHGKSRGRYGARKVWHQLRRDGHDIARCTVERLMRLHGLQGVVRGQKKTTIPDPTQPCPDDKVNRQFVAAMPDQLWVSDFTYVSTWAGMVYVAFIIDVFARRIVGWRVSTSMTTGFVLDALNQAICQRRPTGGGLIHHSDQGSQFTSIDFIKALTDADIRISMDGKGAWRDNVRACPRTGGGLAPSLVERLWRTIKYEEVYLRAYASVPEARAGTGRYIAFYNSRRPQSSHGGRTPDQAYLNQPKPVSVAA